MNEIEVVVARSRAYGLFSRLFLEGRFDDDSASLFEVEGDPEAIAAQHYDLFGMEVFPHEGVFLGESGLVGSVDIGLERLGFAAERRDTSPDHLGVELAAMAFLTGAEAEALADGVASDAIREHQRAFLDDHLLAWLPPFAAAVSDRPKNPWTHLVALVVDLVTDHRAALPATPAAIELHAADPLADPAASLRDIAGWLLTPRRSGIFFSRGDLATIGRDHEIPRGFGSRRQTLTTLLQQAAIYEAFGPVVEDLEALVSRRAAHYAGTLGGAPWLAAAERSRAVLRAMQCASLKTG